MASATVVLGTNQSLAGVKREPESRGKGYVITDSVAGTVVCLAQRIPLASAYLSTLASDRVSNASLYEAALKGRRVHRRWKVELCTLEDCAQRFEEARQRCPGARAVALVHPLRLKVAAA